MHRCYSVIHSVQSDIVHVHCWKEEKHTHAHTHTHTQEFECGIKYRQFKSDRFLFSFLQLLNPRSRAEMWVAFGEHSTRVVQSAETISELNHISDKQQQPSRSNPLAEHHCPIPWLNSMEIKSFFLFFVFFFKKNSFKGWLNTSQLRRFLSVFLWLKHSKSKLTSPLKCGLTEAAEKNFKHQSYF